MEAEGKRVSIAQLCRWFGVPRSTFYYRPEIAATGKAPAIDAELSETIRQVIEEDPAFGVRRITVIVRRKLKRKVDRKKVHRVIQLNGWQVWRKPQGKRPRAQGWTSRSTRPNERWAVDATQIFCGRDGWCHLTAIIDCFDRAIVGWRLSKTGVAKVAAAALEEALRSRESKQEYITPYTPEQNGMIERFFGTLKGECVWVHRFADRDHAAAVISRWMTKYHEERPHSALGYLPGQPVAIR